MNPWIFDIRKGDLSVCILCSATRFDENARPVQFSAARAAVADMVVVTTVVAVTAMAATAIVAVVAALATVADILKKVCRCCILEHQTNRITVASYSMPL